MWYEDSFACRWTVGIPLFARCLPRCSNGARCSNGPVSAAAASGHPAVGAGGFLLVALLQGRCGYQAEGRAAHTMHDR